MLIAIVIPCSVNRCIATSSELTRKRKHANDQKQQQSTAKLAMSINHAGNNDDVDEDG